MHGINQEACHRENQNHKISLGIKFYKQQQRLNMEEFQGGMTHTSTLSIKLVVACKTEKRKSFSLSDQKHSSSTIYLHRQRIRNHMEIWLQEHSDKNFLCSSQFNVLQWLEYMDQDQEDACSNPHLAPRFIGLCANQYLFA